MKQTTNWMTSNILTQHTHPKKCNHSRSEVKTETLQGLAYLRSPDSEAFRPTELPRLTISLITSILISSRPASLSSVSFLGPEKQNDKAKAFDLIYKQIDKIYFAICSNEWIFTIAPFNADLCTYMAFSLFFN